MTNRKDEEADQAAINLGHFIVRKKREKAEKLAAKYFDPGKLTEMDKYRQLVNDFLVLIDNLD